jgi:hypothetical protein
MSSRASTRWVIAIACAAAFACVDYPDEYAGFLDLPVDQRAAAIKGYTPEQQVDLYLWDRRVKNPPALDLADAVARGGDQVLPVLVRRIGATESERTRVDLLYVVLRMQELRVVDVTQDTETMTALQAYADGMDDPDTRRQAQDILLGIRTAS